jgi:hypothetical protein
MELSLTLQHIVMAGWGNGTPEACDMQYANTRTLEHCEILAESCATRYLIRVSFNRIWEEFQTPETEKPASGGPCCPARSREIHVSRQH